MSDGVPEAREDGGELYGFDRLPSLTLKSAREIAETAQRFGQEDDITVLTLAIAKNNWLALGNARIPQTNVVCAGIVHGMAEFCRNQ